MLKILRYFIFVFAIGLLPNVSLAQTCQDSGIFETCPSGLHFYKIIQNSNGDPTGLQLDNNYSSSGLYCFNTGSCPDTTHTCSMIILCRNTSSGGQAVQDHVAVQGQCHLELNGTQAVCLDNCVGYSGVVIGTRFRSKDVSGCPNGCQKRELCNIDTNEISYDATPATSCHVEGSANNCKINTAQCKEFPAGVDSADLNMDILRLTNDPSALLDCPQNNQRGSANWNSSQHKWNVSGCKCVNEEHLIWKNCSGRYQLEPSYSNSSVPSLQDRITYSDSATGMEYYCKSCDPGAAISETLSWPTYSGTVCSYAFDRGDGENLENTYTICGCEKVDIDHFSTGCSFTYPLHSITNPASCMQNCPIGTKASTVGATNVSECNQLNADQRFQDDTGIFTIGSSAQCSNNP